MTNHESYKYHVHTLGEFKSLEDIFIILTRYTEVILDISEVILPYFCNWIADFAGIIDMQKAQCFIIYGRQWETSTTMKVFNFN